MYIGIVHLHKCILLHKKTTTTGVVKQPSHHDVQLGQEVQREVVVGVTQDGLLDQQHVTTPLLDLLALVEDVLPLLAEDAVHGRIVGHLPPCIKLVKK